MANNYYITENGMAQGSLVGLIKAIVTQMGGSTTTGGYIAVGDVVSQGSFASTTAGSGIALSSSRTSGSKIYCDDAGVAATGDCKGLLSRLLLTIDHTGDFSPNAIKGQLKLKDGVDLTNGYAGGVQGYIELAGTNNFGATSFTAAVHGVVELTTASTITAGGLLAGVCSSWKSDATATGDSAAFAGINHPNNTGNWNYFLYAKNCNYFFYTDTGTAYENGVLIGSMSALGGATHVCSGLIKVKVATTDYYIPLYAAGQVTGE